MKYKLEYLSKEELIELCMKYKLALRKQGALAASILDTLDDAEKEVDESMGMTGEVSEGSSIHMLELTARTTNALHDYGVRVIGDLKNMNKEEVMGIDRLGRKSYIELVCVLNKHGFNWLTLPKYW